MRLAVVTANYGGYDTPREHTEQTVDVDWVYVTDNPDLKVPGWRVMHFPHRESMHPRLAAKMPKFLPFYFTDADVAIWLDASFHAHSDVFVADVVAALGDGDIGQWRHPQRDCIYAEADVSMTMLKYEGTTIPQQVKQYRTDGHPENWGLWATGLIAWRRGGVAEELGTAWWDENSAWSYQDQISEPYLLRKLGITPVDLPTGLWSNPWVTFIGHNSEL